MTYPSILQRLVESPDISTPFRVYVGERNSHVSAVAETLRSEGVPTSIEGILGLGREILLRNYPAVKNFPTGDSVSTRNVFAELAIAPVFVSQNSMEDTFV